MEAYFVRPDADHLGDLERAIAQALLKVRELAAQNALPPVLQPLTLIAPPRGFMVDVELHPYTDHAREEEWSRDQRWDPRNGELAIGYEPIADEAPREEQRPPGWYADELRGPQSPVTPPDAQVALQDVVRVVARAESDPTLKFLALKFLRDQLLPRQVPWAARPHEAQIQINYAIDQGVLVTGKVENPRTPQYPVTTVSLNRDHPLVRSLAGATDDGAGAPNGAPAASEGDREPA
jgi:hypothetical protein